MKALKSFSRLIIFIALFLWPFGLVLTLRDVPLSFPKTIFTEDYQARQLILRNTYLYPNVFLARAFQNKLNIPLNKFESNFFSLIDPNFYFFSSHPRELYYNQNLVKFPFILIIFLFYGLFSITKLKNYKKIGVTFLGLVTILSCLKIFDGYDIILWPIFSVVILHGYDLFQKRRSFLTSIILFFLLLITLFEYSRLLITR